MELSSLVIILIGSTVGLILRIFIQKNFTINIGFDIQNTSIINFLAAFFLGILVSMNLMSNDKLLLLCTSFLGCFSTFSSFIYQLFVLFSKRKLLRLFFHYIEIITLSFLFFYLGYSFYSICFK